MKNKMDSRFRENDRKGTFLSMTTEGILFFLIIFYLFLTYKSPTDNNQYIVIEIFIIFVLILLSFDKYILFFQLLRSQIHCVICCYAPLECQGFYAHRFMREHLHKHPPCSMIFSSSAFR